MKIVTLCVFLLYLSLGQAGECTVAPLRSSVNLSEYDN